MTHQRSQGRRPGAVRRLAVSERPGSGRYDDRRKGLSEREYGIQQVNTHGIAQEANYAVQAHLADPFDHESGA